MDFLFFGLSASSIWVQRVDMETGREKMITHPSQAESKKREAATKEVYTTQRSKETTMIMILEASRDLCCACANTVSLSDRETEELVQLGKERNYNCTRSR